MIEAREDKGGLLAAYEASMETPCVAEKLSGTTPEQFMERLSGMRVLSFYDGETPIGAAVFHENFGHIGIRRGYHGRWANRGVLREISRMWGESPAAMVDHRNDKAMSFTFRLGLTPRYLEGNMVRFQ